MADDQDTQGLSREGHDEGMHGPRNLREETHERGAGYDQEDVSRY